MIIQRFVAVNASINKKIVAILIALIAVSSYGVLNAAGSQLGELSQSLLMMVGKANTITPFHCCRQEE
jgi:hypothetical protein